MAITKEDLRALREATSLAFHYSTHPELTNGAAQRSYVRAWKRTAATSDAVWGSDEREAYRDIECSRSSFSIHDALGGADHVTSAVDSIISAQVAEEWRTVAGLLRVGDELELWWTVANDTENLKTANLSHDSLVLRIVREKARRPLVFHLTDRICPPYSSARMVQRKARA